MQNNAMEKVGAGFFVRLAAYIVDSIIVGAALLTVRFPLWILRLSDGNNILFRDIIFKYSITDILFYVLHVTYFILMTYFAGATLGKRLFHIRVVSSENRDFTFFEIVYRETVGRFLSSIILYIGYLMVIVNGDKLGLHDILSDTRVVYCHVKKLRVQPPVSYKNVPPQNGVPYQGNMPQQNGMPYQGNVPQQNGTPTQGNEPPHI